MSSRLAVLDRSYRQRITFTVPVAGALLVASLFVVPVEELTALRRPEVAQRGPLRILPQIDIVAEESERHLTAAPLKAIPADFVAVDLVYSEQEVPLDNVIPLPVALPEISEENPFEQLTREDVQDAIRTTGLPVPAQSELEVLRVQRPVYPREAVQLGIEGTVEVLLLVDQAGRVNQAFVLKDRRLSLLEEAALDAARMYLFSPYRVGGKATPFWVRLPFEFALVS